MPNYKGHLAGGIFAYCITLCIICAQPPALAVGLEWLLCTLLGSLFPDVDTKSKGRKIFYRIIPLLILFFAYQHNFFGALFMIGLGVFPLLVRHRGILHNLWFVLLLPLGLVCYSSLCLPHYAPTIKNDAFFFSIGVISHLWLDLGFKKCSEYDNC